MDQKSMNASPGSFREFVQHGRHSDNFVQRCLDLQAKTKTVAIPQKTKKDTKKKKNWLYKDNIIYQLRGPGSPVPPPQTHQPGSSPDPIEMGSVHC